MSSQGPSPRSEPSGELFSIVDGKKTDAHFHEPILSGVHLQHDEDHRWDSMMRAIDGGMSHQDAALLFGFKEAQQS